MELFSFHDNGMKLEHDWNIVGDGVESCWRYCKGQNPPPYTIQTELVKQENSLTLIHKNAPC